MLQRENSYASSRLPRFKILHVAVLFIDLLFHFQFAPTKFSILPVGNYNQI
jgi:hypothetical protein